MKKYDTNKMLEAWGTSGSLSSNDPFPAPPVDGDENEDLINQSSSDLTTNISSTDGHAINKAIHANKSNVREADIPQDKAMPPDLATPPKQPPLPSTTPPPQSDPANAAVDPSMMGGDPNAIPQDPSMMGMGMGGPTSTFDVGRVYELKKIYSRLVSMQSYLSGTSDPNLIKLRNYVAGTMDLFRTLISNVSLYKDRLDEVIVVFYKVVDNVYSILSKYYKDKDSGKMVQAIENKLYKKEK